MNNRQFHLKNLKKESSTPFSFSHKKNEITPTIPTASKQSYIKCEKWESWGKIKFIGIKTANGNIH